MTEEEAEGIFHQRPPFPVTVRNQCLDGDERCDPILVGRPILAASWLSSQLIRAKLGGLFKRVLTLTILRYDHDGPSFYRRFFEPAGLLTKASSSSTRRRSRSS